MTCDLISMTIILYSRPFAWLILTFFSLFSFHQAPFDLILWTPIGLICVINFMIETYVSLSFITPGRKKKSFADAGWKQQYITVEGKKLNAVSFQQKDPSPLLFLIHGWRASSHSVGDRGRWFAQHGWHVVLVDLPNHGDSDNIPLWSAYKSMQYLALLCEQVSDIIPNKNVTQATYYGHSIGGFIGLRLLSQKKEIKISGRKFTKLILESPMTMYSPILEEIAARLRIPKPLLNPYRKRLIQRFNSTLSPRGTFDSMEDFDLPRWGLPTLPILCIQASPDNRLGLGHYERLLQSYEVENEGQFVTHHLVEGLTHSGAKINEERDQLISQWLEKEF